VGTFHLHAFIFFTMILRLLCFLPLFLLVRLPAAPVGAPESILPADVLLAIHVRDVSAFESAIQGTLMGRVWNAPEGAVWREEMRKFLDEGSYFDELGVTNREFMRMLPGSWVMALRVPSEGSEHPAVAGAGLEKLDSLETILLLQPDSAEQFRAFLEDADARIAREKPDRKIEEEVYHGHTIYTDSWTDSDGQKHIGSAYAVTPEWFVFCEDPATVRDVLDAQADRSRGRRLNQAAGWLEASDRMDGGLVTVFANGALLGDLLDKTIRAIDPRSPFVTQFGIDPERLARVLRLDVLGGAHAVLVRENDELLVRAGFTWQETAGVVSWLRSDVLPNLPAMAPPGILSGSVGGFDIGHFWKRFEGALQELNPDRHQMLNAQLETWKRDLGLDLRGALLDNFGPHTSSFADARAAEGEEMLAAPVSQVVHLSLRDPEAFVTFWRRLLEVVPMLGSFWIERDFSGTPVWDLQLPPGLPLPPMAVGMAVAHGGLVLELQGKGLLDRVLAQGPADRTLWDDRDLRPALAALSPATVGIAVLDLERLGPMFERILGAAIEVSEKDGGATADDLKQARAARAIFRSLALPAWAVTASEERPRALLSETRVVEKQP